MAEQKSSYQEKSFDGDTNFWERYIKGRPIFPDSFFDRIFEYHASHDGSFGRAHDIGAGGGIHSNRLAKKFSHVLISDPSQDNIETARFRLGKGGQYEYRVSKTEDYEGLQPASFDMVFGSAMIHFTDVPKAMEAIGFQLKSRGSLVIVASGVPFFQDEKLQDAWREIYNAGSRRWIEDAKKSGAEAQILKVCEIAYSGYDAVSVPGDIFEPGVVRLKLNWPGQGPWFGVGIPADLQERCPYISRKGAGDVLRNEDDDDWNFEADIAKIEEFFQSVPFPSLTEDEEFIALWQKIKDIVGDGTCRGWFPTTVILATKK